MHATILINQFLFSAIAGLSLTAAISDLRVYRIPNWLTAGIAALYPLHVLMSPVPVPWAWSLGLAAGIFVIGIPLFVAGYMGGGDVKLMAALSLWAGPAYILDFLFITAIAGGVMALVVTTRLKTILAYAFDSAGRTAWRDKLLADVLPYGVAIAVGGTYVAIMRLVG